MPKMHPPIVFSVLSWHTPSTSRVLLVSSGAVACSSTVQLKDGINYRKFMASCATAASRSSLRPHAKPPEQLMHFIGKSLTASFLCLVITTCQLQLVKLCRGSDCFLARCD